MRASRTGFALLLPVKRLILSQDMVSVPTRSLGAYGSTDHGTRCQMSQRWATDRDVGKIQQGHEVYLQWLRHRVSLPKRGSFDTGGGST